MRYEELLIGKGQDNRFVWGDIVSLLFWLMQEHLHFEKPTEQCTYDILQFLYACFTLLGKCSKISRDIRGNKLTTYHSEASLIAQLVKNPPIMEKALFHSWVGKIHWRRDRLPIPVFLGFSCGSAGKESTFNPGDLGSILGLGRSPGEGKGYPLQYSGLENLHGQRSLEVYSP